MYDYPNLTRQQPAPPNKREAEREVSLTEFEEMVRAKYGIPQPLWQAMPARAAGGERGAQPAGGGKYQVAQTVAAGYGKDRDDPFDQAYAAARYLREQYDALPQVKDERARWLGATARYYGGNSAGAQDSALGSAREAVASNPADQVDRVAREWAEPENGARQQAVPRPSAPTTATTTPPAARPRSVSAKPAGQPVTPLPLRNSERRYAQAAQAIREIESEKQRAIGLFQQAGRLPADTIAGDDFATARERTLAQAEGALDKANRLGERAKRQFGDLIEVGYGADADPHSPRQWVYAKPKHVSVQYFYAPRAEERVANKAASMSDAEPEAPGGRPYTDPDPVNRRREAMQEALEEIRADAARSAQGAGVVSRLVAGAGVPVARAAAGVLRFPKRLKAELTGAEYDPTSNDWANKFEGVAAALEGTANPTNDERFLTAGNLGNLAGTLVVGLGPGRAARVIPGAGILARGARGAAAGGATLGVLASGTQADNRAVAKQAGAGAAAGAAGEAARPLISPLAAKLSAVAPRVPLLRALPPRAVAAAGARAGMVAGQGTVGGAEQAAQSYLLGERDPEKLKRDFALGAVLSNLVNPLGGGVETPGATRARLPEEAVKPELSPAPTDQAGQPLPAAAETPVTPAPAGAQPAAKPGVFSFSQERPAHAQDQRTVPVETAEGKTVYATYPRTAFASLREAQAAAQQAYKSAGQGGGTEAPAPAAPASRAVGEPEAVDALAETVLRVIHEAGGELPRARLWRDTKLAPAQLRPALDALKQAGRVVEAGGKVRLAEGETAPPVARATAATEPERTNPETGVAKASYRIDEIPAAAQLDTKSRAVETRLRKYLAEHFDEAVTRYRARFGKELNTDNARELSRAYAASHDARSNFSTAVHQPASWFVRQLYRRMLAEPPPAGQAPRVLFTAGGTGAGKTSALNAVPRLAHEVEKSQIIMDGNLNNPRIAIEKIDQALEAGKEVGVIAVYRDPVEAWRNGVLPRAESEGRTVPLAIHVETHAQMRDAIYQLVAHYYNEPRVRFEFLDNSRGKDNAKEAGIEIFRPIEDNQGLLDKLRQELETQYQQGKISPRVYRGSQ